MSRAFLWANSRRGPLEWLLYTPKESRKGLMVGYDISHENTDLKMESTEQTQNKPRNRFPKFCLQVYVNLIEQDTAIFTSVQKLRTHHVSKSCKMQLNRDCSKKLLKIEYSKKLSCTVQAWSFTNSPHETNPPLEQHHRNFRHVAKHLLETEQVTPSRPPL